MGRQRKKPSKCFRIAANTHTRSHTRTRNMVPWRRALSPFCIYTPRSTPFKRQHTHTHTLSPSLITCYVYAAWQGRASEQENKRAARARAQAKCKQAQVWWLPLWEMPTGSSWLPPAAPPAPPAPPASSCDFCIENNWKMKAQKMHACSQQLNASRQNT